MRANMKFRSTVQKLGPIGTLKEIGNAFKQQTESSGLIKEAKDTELTKEK